MKTDILFSVAFFRKSCPLWNNMEIYCRMLQATEHIMAPAQWMLDTWGYKHTLNIWKSYSFHSGIMVARTPLNFTIYVYWLSGCCLPSLTHCGVLTVNCKWTWRLYGDAYRLPRTVYRAVRRKWDLNVGWGTLDWLGIGRARWSCIVQIECRHLQ
jgi:hypothetical protein